MYNSNPTITDLLVATLGSSRSSRRFHQIIQGREFQRYNKESVRVGLSRLKNKGYLLNNSSCWSLTSKGKSVARDIKLFSYITSPFDKDCTNSMILSFDIPEKNRIIRRWLRNQLKIFGYKMLQQSLWIGPGPLPVPFLKRLEDLNVRKNIKTFKIKRVG
jgi:DNA-binding transcriptional regulator PaaX